MPVKKTAKAPMKSRQAASQPALPQDKKISNPGELFNLIKYLEAEKVDEFEYSDQDFSVSLKRTVSDFSGAPGPDASSAILSALVGRRPQQAVQQKPAAAQTESDGVSAVKPQAPPVEDESKFKFIESPIIGTFYRSPSPTSAPYVESGHRVKKGQVVCIVEAMKLMNEIKSEHDGVIDRICVENGTLVQAKQRLFYVRPE